MIAGALLWITLFATAQVVAGVAMLCLGRGLLLIDRDPHWFSWLLVGILGILACMGFLRLVWRRAWLR